MKHFGSTLVMGACAFFAQASLANADGTDLLYAPPAVEAAAPVGVSGFYIRGQIGFSNHDVDEIFSDTFNQEGAHFTHLTDGFETGGIFGGGVGYRWNKHLRFDVTGEYRGKSTFHGLDKYETDFDFFGTNQYTSTHTGWLALFNGYVDLGTWWCFTPYVGGGIGWARNEVEEFIDVNVPNHGVAFSKGGSESDFAWAIHAGIAYEVTPNLTIDFGYRYTDLGDARSGTIHAYDGSGSFPELEYKDLHSHDLMLSVRYQCCGHAPVAAYTSLK